MHRFLNYNGEEILLSENSWDHICEFHPEISQDMISNCLLQPDEVRRSSSNPRGELYYVVRAHKRFICVIIKRCPDGNFISTAMITSKPKFGDIIYKRD